jgi:hypothetical protein
MSTNTSRPTTAGLPTAETATARTVYFAADGSAWTVRTARWPRPSARWVHALLEDDGHRQRRQRITRLVGLVMVAYLAFLEGVAVATPDLTVSAVLPGGYPVLWLWFPPLAALVVLTMWRVRVTPDPRTNRTHP